MADKPKYVTVKKLSEWTGRPESTIYYWIREGKVAAVSGGLFSRGRLMIPLEEAERVLRELSRGELID